MDYLRSQRATGFKVGDEVMVTCRAEQNEMGWNNSWVPEMTVNIGKILKITKISGEYGIELNHGCCYPYFVLQKLGDMPDYLCGKIKEIENTYPLELEFPEESAKKARNAFFQAFRKVGFDALPKTVKILFAIELGKERGK
jgi:hypothetical protein